MATAKIEDRVMDLITEDPHEAREKWGEMEGTDLQKQIIREALDNPNTTPIELAERSGAYTPQWVVKTLARTDRDMWRKFLDHDGEDNRPAETQAVQTTLAGAEEDPYVGVFVMARADSDDLSEQLSDVLAAMR